MEAMMMTSGRTRWVAGMFAALATALTLGGSLLLADHYAGTGETLAPADYYAAGHASRIGCADNGDNGNSRAAMVTSRRAS